MKCFRLESQHRLIIKLALYEYKKQMDSIILQRWQVLFLSDDSQACFEQKQEHERVYLHLWGPPLTIHKLCRESETAKFILSLLKIIIKEAMSHKKNKRCKHIWLYTKRASCLLLDGPTLIKIHIY